MEGPLLDLTPLSGLPGSGLGRRTPEVRCPWHHVVSRPHRRGDSIAWLRSAPGLPRRLPSAPSDCALWKEVTLHVPPLWLGAAPLLEGGVAAVWNSLYRRLISPAHLFI